MLSNHICPLTLFKLKILARATYLGRVCVLPLILSVLIEVIESTKLKFLLHLQGTQLVGLVAFGLGDCEHWYDYDPADAANNSDAVSPPAPMTETYKTWSETLTRTGRQS